jgi:hypothetical protein
MIRPSRERPAGVVEVDESYLGCDEKGVLGRHIARMDSAIKRK